MRIASDDLPPPNNAEYRIAYNNAANEFRAIKLELQEIERTRAEKHARLHQLEGIMRAIHPMCEAEVDEEREPALGPVCYGVLANLGRASTAPEIRLLTAHIVNLHRYKNPLAMIHMALKRMPNVECFKGEDNKTYYIAR